ncbi:hypothetical protein ACFLTW_00655 [Chloroflexota bacterium]
MAKKDKGMSTGQENIAENSNQVSQQMEMFDQRLDNIDSVVSALVERVMKQPATLAITCPKCGHHTEIAIVGNQKPGR